MQRGTKKRTDSELHCMALESQDPQPVREHPCLANIQMIRPCRRRDTQDIQ